MYNVYVDKSLQTIKAYRQCVGAIVRLGVNWCKGTAVRHQC